MDNLIQLAMQIIFCLLIAAILGAIIGYLLGKMSKCDKDEYNEDDDFHGAKKQKKKLNDYNNNAHRENISSGIGKAETMAAAGVASVGAVGAGLMSSAKNVGSSIGEGVSDTASYVKDTGENIVDGAKDMGGHISDSVNHQTEKYTKEVTQELTPSASIGQEIGIRPQSIRTPENNELDDLKEISGIGLKIEEVLNNLGVYHFSQISEWSPENVEWIENYLSVKRRVLKEDWIGQARLLAAGGHTDFSKKVRRGDNRNY